MMTAGVEILEIRKAFFPTELGIRPLVLDKHEQILLAILGGGGSPDFTDGGIESSQAGPRRKNCPVVPVYVVSGSRRRRAQIQDAVQRFHRDQLVRRHGSARLIEDGSPLPWLGEID
jgi:hypothetical protein